MSIFDIIVQAHIVWGQGLTVPKDRKLPTTPSLASFRVPSEYPGVIAGRPEWRLRVGPRLQTSPFKDKCSRFDTLGL
jgi:hypothetical protein